MGSPSCSSTAGRGQVPLGWRMGYLLCTKQQFRIPSLLGVSGWGDQKVLNLKTVILLGGSDTHDGNNSDT